MVLDAGCANGNKAEEGNVSKIATKLLGQACHSAMFVQSNNVYKVYAGKPKLLKQLESYTSLVISTNM